MRTLVALAHTHVQRHDLVRYLIAGGFNTGLTFIIYVSGVYIGVPYRTANVIAWCVGLVVSFLLSSTFVFRRGFVLRRFPKFILTNLFSLGVSTGALTVLVKYVGLDPVTASIITIPIVVALNFLAGKFIVFGKSV